MTELIKNRLKNELPGLESQLKMSININGKPFRRIEPTGDARQSAVFLLIKDINSNPKILFTQRSFKLKSHAGQISFPGGMIEKKETPLDAAFRETFEETGIEENNIEVLGKLSNLFVPPSNSLIYPYVGLIKNEFEFKISEREVDEAFYVELDFFMNKENLKFQKWNRDDKIYDVPCWNVGKTVPLWGATAMILSEFLELFH